MGWTRYVQDVRDAVHAEPWLEPVFYHVLDIPRRLWEHERDLFLVWNRRAGRYEVHALGYPPGRTFQMIVRFRHLDARLLRDVQLADVRRHGRAIVREVFARMERAERRRERARRNMTEAIAKEIRPALARIAWE